MLFVFVLLIATLGLNVSNASKIVTLKTESAFVIEVSNVTFAGLREKLLIVEATVTMKLLILE